MANILILASNAGLWAEELQAPWDVLTEAGHTLTLATNLGKTPLPFAYSMDVDFVDPLLHTHVVPKDVYERVRELLESGAWDAPKSIGIVTEQDGVAMEDFDALVIVGGPGAAIDLTGNPKVHALLVDAWKSGKTIGAMCYGVGALAWARQPEDYEKSIVHGKTVVAHPKEWDYDMPFAYDLWGATEDNPSPDLVTPGFLYPLRAVMEGAVGPEGTVISPPETTRENPCVHYDAPFVTGLSIESSRAFGEKVAEVLAGA